MGKQQSASVCEGETRAVTSIPSDELERLAACVRDAWNLAAQDRVLEGFAVLDLGLTWAEMPALNPATGQQNAAEPWAAELTALYRAELRRYMLENRQALGSACLARRVQLTRENASELRATARLLCDHAGQLRRQATRLVQRLADLRTTPERPEEHSIH